MKARPVSVALLAVALGGLASLAYLAWRIVETERYLRAEEARYAALEADYAAWNGICPSQTDDAAWDAVDAGVALFYAEALQCRLDHALGGRDMADLTPDEADAALRYAGGLYLLTGDAALIVDDLRDAVPDPRRCELENDAFLDFAHLAVIEGPRRPELYVDYPERAVDCFGCSNWGATPELESRVRALYGEPSP